MSRDDTPSGPYTKETLPEHLRAHTFYRDVPSDAEVDALFEEMFAAAYPGGVIEAHVDREGARLVETSQSLADRARAYADGLLAAVSPAQRIEFAAAPARETRAPHSPFNTRKPEYLPDRHGPYKDVTRAFSEVSMRMGRGPAWGIQMKNELLLIELVNGRVPIVPITDGRKKHVNENENVIGTALFRPLWDQHEIALAESEARGIAREFEAVPSQLQSRKAELLQALWHAMTLCKTCRRPEHLRAVYKVFATVIEAARQEIT